MEGLFFRVIMALTMGITVAVVIDVQNRKEVAGDQKKGDEPKYAPFVSPYALPFYILLLVFLWPMVQNRYGAITELIMVLFDIFLHISLYYVVLLLVMPKLRGRISARVCAVLWILPTFLYILGRIQVETFFVRPLVVIPLLRIPALWLCVIWGVGFLAVLLWKCVSHLRFRKRILQHAESVTDPTALRLWGEEQTAAQVYQGTKTPLYYFPLVQSEEVSTPLAIGLFKSTTYMVLPKKEYTPEELTLIFRHELVHIGRQDSGNKFFLVFCAAMCWFNPLMWIAMRQCAKDLELSCDETVLLHSDPQEKHQYARLLLQTAGDDRGFTTCLSASGESMRYRLKQVTEPSKRRVGSVIAGAFLCALFLSYGTVTIAYDPMSGEEAIFTRNNPYELSDVETDILVGTTIAVERVEAPLREYLSQLEVYRLGSDYTGGTHSVMLRYTNPSAFVILADGKMEVYHLGSENRVENFYFSEPLDWEYLRSILSVQD